MTVSKSDEIIVLAGDCTVEDAEILLELLLADRKAVVDLSQCGSVHAAVAQVLLASRAAIQGVPAEPLLADWIVPQILDEARKTNSRKLDGGSS